MTRFIIFLSLVLMPAIAEAQIRCPSCLVKQKVYVETKVQRVDYVPVVTETTELVECVSYVQPAFDVDCALRIAEDYLACSANATTRRQRFRCAFTAALNNIDCIMGTSTVSSRVGLFPRFQARRAARQMVRGF